jgi:hypothetical protein
MAKCVYSGVNIRKSLRFPSAATVGSKWLSPHGRRLFRRFALITAQRRSYSAKSTYPMNASGECLAEYHAQQSAAKATKQQIVSSNLDIRREGNHVFSKTRSGIATQNRASNRPTNAETNNIRTYLFGSLRDCISSCRDVVEHHRPVAHQATAKTHRHVDSASVSSSGILLMSFVSRSTDFIGNPAEILLGHKPWILPNQWWPFVVPFMPFVGANSFSNRIVASSAGIRASRRRGAETFRIARSPS